MEDALHHPLYYTNPGANAFTECIKGSSFYKFWNFLIPLGLIPVSKAPGKTQPSVQFILIHSLESYLNVKTKRKELHFCQAAYNLNASILARCK